jgi:hypothetical protein
MRDSKGKRDKRERAVRFYGRSPVLGVPKVELGSTEIQRVSGWCWHRVGNGTLAPSLFKSV